MERSILSWGRAHRYSHQVVNLAKGADQSEALQAAAALPGTMIPRGLGRSYGDVALNDGGRLLLTPRMDNMIAADWTTGRIRAAAGLSLEQLLRICVPKGWFPAVVPGTKFVTLGGAVANDIHGKNHHQAGSFGVNVVKLQLRRSNRDAIVCSRDENADMFALTLGGLGLTGLIEWVELQLTPVRSGNLDVENHSGQNLEEFFELTEASKEWPYTVMWVDCFATGTALGRGVFTRARFAEAGGLVAHKAQKALTWPIETPGFLLNKTSISAFNALYRKRPAASYKGPQHYDSFFFPLDGIQEWNRMYGRKGFFQHQSLIPMEQKEQGIRQLLETIEHAGQGSFLAVLKVHGPERSPGIMSFCREGVSLALDFANKGQKTRQLLEQLDNVVQSHGGRLYPAKDGHMSSSFFKEAYPRWRELEDARDPNFSSSFWRRVTQST